MLLFIKPNNDTAREFYRNHGHFHDGDAGLDLYVLEDIHFEPGETKAIKLGISCEPEDGVAYYLFNGLPTTGKNVEFSVSRHGFTHCRQEG